MSKYEIFYNNNTSKKVTTLIKELNYPKNGDSKFYNYYQNSSVRWRLREVLRVLFGMKETYDCPPSDLNKSPSKLLLDLINNGKDINITTKNKVNLKISAKDAKDRQKKTKIYFDKKFISEKEIQDILLIKSGKKPQNIPKGIKLSQYEEILERKASYYVIRGEPRKEFDLKGRKVPGKNYLKVEQNKYRIIAPSYYACMPRLVVDQNGIPSPDLKQYCKGTKRGDYSISDGKGLKEKFKDVIKLQLMVAAQHKEAVDIVTPNAFFSALSKIEQDKAKKIFYEAIAEVAINNSFNGLSALFIHSDKSHDSIVRNNYKNFQFPVVIGDGDSASPQTASKIIWAKEQDPNNKFDVAQCIMGDPLGPTGNGALSNRADKAKEENDFRMYPFMFCIFSAIYNKNLLDEKKYSNLNIPNTKVKSQIIIGSTISKEKDTPLLVQFGVSKNTAMKVIKKETSYVNTTNSLQMKPSNSKATLSVLLELTRNKECDYGKFYSLQKVNNPIVQIKSEHLSVIKKNLDSIDFNNFDKEHRQAAMELKFYLKNTQKLKVPKNKL